MLQNARDMPSGQERLFASLRISYDSLESSQRRMFLDAAFFFLGRSADTALRAWKGYAKVADSSQCCSAMSVMSSG